MQRLFYAPLLFIASLLVSSTLLASSPENIVRQPAAQWVNVVKFDIPKKIPTDDIDRGIYYLLVDEQIRVNEKIPSNYYYHYAEKVTNQQGLKNASNIRIEFDPSYESLVLHSLTIHRNNENISKLASSKIDVIQREQEIENQLYDGRLTANVIIADVRVGDIVEFSYTLTGENPVYKDYFSQRSYIEWSVPLHQQYLRILWGKNKPLYITPLNTQLNVKETQLNDFVEYRINLFDQDIRKINDEVPSWFDPFGMIYFSESKNWSEVVSWAMPLYDNAYSSESAITKVAGDIVNLYPDKSDQIAKALEFVQSEIRYLGIEMGVNSHTPSQASATLERRYGDCKDKAVLLISLLKQLDINASPVLVNSSKGRQIGQFPPSVNAFNHVIVRVYFNNMTYWLDPTRQYQKGSLDNLYQPNYGYALEISSGVDALVSMDSGYSNSAMIFKDTFDLSQGGGNEVKFTTISEYQGLEADKQRYRVANMGVSKLQDTYLEFHQDYYSKVEPLQKLSVKDNEKSGAIIFDEHYVLNDFWLDNEEEKQFETSFYANAISPFLAKPDQEIRNSPYALKYPLTVKQYITILFSDEDWEFDNEEFVESNRFFYFKRLIDFDLEEKILNISYEYKTFTDHVAAEDTEAFIKANKLAKNKTEYSILEYYKSDVPAATQEAGENTVQIVLYSLILGFLLVIAFIFINWRLDSKKQPAHESMVFYPVSLTKLYFLSALTFGVYPIYWFYRNWIYVKALESSSIMPVARGIFNYVWFYPFYKHLVSDSLIRYEKNTVLAKYAAILLAFVYFIFVIMSSADYIGLPLIILAPLLLFPLANYINHINTGDNEPYLYNSRWLLRHTLIGVIFVPLVLLSYGGELNLLPSSKVVSGDKIWSHDMKYMHRNSVIPADEKVVLFYSDAFLSIQDDGNGFTDEVVFSYWRDDATGLHVENEKLTKVKDIKVSYAASWDGNTTITIVRRDDTDFVLYVSAEGRLDKKFVNKLTSRWNIVRGVAGD